MSEEALADLSQELATKMLALLLDYRGQPELFVATGFAFAAVGAAMSALIASGMAPAMAPQLLATTAAGVAEDLS